MNGAEVFIAKQAAKPVIALFKKWRAERQLDKDIEEVFHRAFDSCPDSILAVCHDNSQFRKALFNLADSQNADAGKLLDWGEKTAGEAYTRQELCQHLFDFSNELLNQCYAHKRKALGDIPGVCADFKNQMNTLLLSGEGAASADKPEPAQPPAPLNYLPHRPNPQLKDYDGYVAQISRALETEGQATVNQADVALSGLGGIGKTAMAVAYAYSHAERYPGGVFWLQADLGLSQALAELAKDLGWDLPDDLNDQQITKEVLARLQTRELKLLILDNQDEHVVPEEISQIPASHLLVTTRLSDVNVGAQVSMGLPAEEEALGIFLAYANLEDADLGPAQAEAAYAICRRVGFLPLALEILGKNARSQSLPDLAQALDQAVTQKSTVATKKQELSIAAALAVSGQKYSHPRAQEALLHLAYLQPEELSKDILALVMGVEEPEAQEMLVSLAQFSVVQPGAEGGYSMHRLVQEAARLEDEGQEVGERLVEVLDEEIKAVDEKGEYRTGYWLIPHLLQIAVMSRHDAGEDDFPSNQALVHWVHFLYQSGRYEPAERVQGAELAQAEVLDGKEHQNYAGSLNNLAEVLRAQGNYPEAEKLYRQALEIDEKTIGKQHPDYAIHFNNLALVQDAQGNYPEAEKLYRQAMKITEKAIGKEHPSYAIRLNNLAEVLRAQGNYPEAEKLYRQAMAIDEKTIGKEHPDYAIYLNNLALVLREQGKFPETEELFRQAMAIDEKTIGKQHPNYAIDLNNLAGVLRAQGKLNEAVEPLRQAVDICLKTLGPEHPQTITIQEGLDIVLSEITD